MKIRSTMFSIRIKGLLGEWCIRWNLRKKKDSHLKRNYFQENPDY